MKKIVFIEPKAPGFHIFSRYPLPRLGSFILGTMMKERGWDTEVFVEDVNGLDMDAVLRADIACISTITPTAPRAYEIADEIRRAGVPVIVGGPHASFLAEESLEHADYVMRGEGDASFPLFIEAWKTGAGMDEVPNLSYKMEGVPVHNPMTPLIQEMDAIPWPDFSLLRGGLRIIGGIRIIPVQTSRGCPFSCSFCSVTGMFGRGYRTRSVDNVMAELRRYNNPGDYVFFYDDNFTANRARTKELLRRMIDERLPFRWSAQVRADVAKDEELVRLMKAAKCHTVFIGFESVNPDSLLKMKKSQTVGDIEDAIGIIQSHGIHIHGMFVFGFDEDSPATVEATVRFARRVQLSSLQFLILTPLPGSELYGRLESEGRIISRDWSHYDTHHVVFKPKNFTIYELQRAQIHGHSRLFSFTEITKKLLKRNMIGFWLGVYARGLNKRWSKVNRDYVKSLI